MTTATENLKAGISVVVDNTNPDREVRKAWVSLASKHDVPIRCFHFTASKELARHNDAVRAMNMEVNISPLSRIRVY
jgi:bifunctional polynucleotide phosphatase/kinase